MCRKFIYTDLQIYVFFALPALQKKLQYSTINQSIPHSQTGLNNVHTVTQPYLGAMLSLGLLLLALCF